VDAYPGMVNQADFTAAALYSDMSVTGSVHCSNLLANQVQHNIEWEQKGNFLDVPTDYLQRDEYLGWIGDAEVFSRTTTLDCNTNSFLAR
jgi:alpha-L-rhamnosidase